MTRIRNFLQDETGTGPIEFVFVFPIIFLVFTASFESSMFMARYVMFDRAVDEVVRQIRLGNYRNFSHQDLKQRICSEGMMVNSIATCMQDMKIWMQPVNTGTFAMTAPPRNCVDRSQPINLNNPPANEFAYGTDNDIMLLRICLKEQPMFPTTAISLNMASEPDGTYALIVTSTFVNEPG
ncbi:TadE/TadG family type IV pilus assembly protein [Tabrizicola sp.]|uniref:TadE/TadG family type IV pilus assembly protein n=1 Tax=Tabrizicola sp. TaxID=2005166 RepID=UPI0027334F13|nr:TadE family protein [Tabrizicola sp.]MDP3194981.1 pilus assembly protein [Tabrizicola sp.]